MTRVRGAFLCLLVAGVLAVAAAAALDAGWDGLLLIWWAWLALPVLLTAIAVLAGHTPVGQGLVISGAAVGATIAFHVIVFQMADPFAFVLLPLLTFLVLSATVAILALSGVSDDP